MSNAEARLLLLGEQGCGKTKLAQRLTGQEEPDLDFTLYAETDQLDDSGVVSFPNGSSGCPSVYVVDSPGLTYDRCQKSTRSCISECQIIALLIDITLQKSLDNVKLKYLDIVRQELDRSGAEAALVLIATKGDLEEIREIEAHAANIFAKDKGIRYLEVSSKTREGIPELLRYLSTHAELYRAKEPLRRLNSRKKVSQQASAAEASGGGGGGGGVDHESISNVFNMNALVMASYSPNTRGLELMYKVVLVGDSGVGKTSLVLQWKLGEILEDYLPTTEVLDYVKSLDVAEEESTILLVWDTPGEERYRHHALKKVREAHIVLIVYDATSEQSFIKADEWIELVKEAARDDSCVVVVANKADLEEDRKVAASEGRALATLDDFEFDEVSAKDRDAVTQMLVNAVKLVQTKRALSAAAMAARSQSELTATPASTASEVMSLGARGVNNNDDESKYGNNKSKKAAGSKFCTLL